MTVPYFVPRIFSALIISVFVLTTESTTCRPETHNTCLTSEHVTPRCVHVIGQESGYCQCVSGYTPSPYGCREGQRKPLVKVEVPEESAFVAQSGATVRLRCVLPVERAPEWIVWRVGVGTPMVRTGTDPLLNATLFTLGTHRFSCAYQLFGTLSPESSILSIEVVNNTSTLPTFPGVSLTVEGMPGFVTAFPATVLLRCVGQLMAARKHVRWFYNGHLAGECRDGPCDHVFQVTEKTEGDVSCEVTYPGLGGFKQKSQPRPVPTLQETLQPIHIPEGDLLFYTDGNRPLTLTCEHGSPSTRFGDDVIITWYLDHMVLPDQRSKVMRLSPVHRHHSGLYHCVVNSSTSHRSAFSSPVSVVVDPITKVRLSAKPAVPVTGGHVTLTCSMEYATVVWNSFAVELKFTWYLNGRLIEGHVDSKLQMDNVDFESDMNFTCETTANRRIMQSNSLVLSAAILFKDVPQPVLAIEDGKGNHAHDVFEYDTDYLMHCLGDQRLLTPGVEYQFLRDGVVFVTSKTPRVPLPKSLTSLLYSCRMIFTGSASPRSEQHAIVFNGLKNVAVHYNGQEISNLEVYRGQHVTFHCHAETYPGLELTPLLFQWKVNGVLVSTQQNYSMEVRTDHVTITCLAALDSRPYLYHYVINLLFAARCFVTLFVFLVTIDVCLSLIRAFRARCCRDGNKDRVADLSVRFQGSTEDEKMIVG